MDVANDPCLIEQSGVNLKDAFRKLHIREYNGNLHVGMSALILIQKLLPRMKWQIHANVLQLSLQF